MHEHDLDLIAALADGSLGDQTEARALVDSCDICHTEYLEQTEVLALISNVPSARMTELEKAALHRDLWTEVRRAPARAQSTPWWQRWSYVAAGLFVAVGLVGVLDLAQDSGGEAAGTTAAEATADLQAPRNEEGVPFVAGEDSAEGGGESVTTTAAAEQALPPPFAELADEARARRDEGTMSTLDSDEGADECLTRLGLDEHEVVDEIELDHTYLVVMPVDAQAEQVVTFVILADCAIAHVDG
ncbi:MAG: hypothetical protein ACRDX9_16055 [Acidimicrobiia bacterium]